tara:strand:+ start:243 stop:443 length:201 start_codon:yes stop_codon:yes gene_type:complete
MATPTNKSTEVETHISSLFGVNRRSYIMANVCTLCSKPATEFKDALSEKEFTISGMCQSCQDSFFN